MAHDPHFTEFEQGERAALLQLRSFITRQGLKLKSAALVKEIDLFCATRLNDIRMDASQRDRRD